MLVRIQKDLGSWSTVKMLDSHWGKKKSKNTLISDTSTEVTSLGEQGQYSFLFELD